MRFSLLLLLVAVPAFSGASDEQWLAACRSDSPEAGLELLKEGPDLKRKTKYDCTLLYLCTGGSHVLVEAMLAKGAKVDTLDNSGRPPLHSAIYFGRAENVKLLLAAGAKTGWRNALGETLMHVAGEYGSGPEIVGMLAGAGLSIDARDGEGKTPLMTAAVSRRKGIGTMSALLERGADVNARAKNGQTALWFVARDAGAFGPTDYPPYQERLDLLLAKGADANLGHIHEGPPLSQAYKRYPMDGLVTTLLAHGADPDAIDERRKTPRALLAEWNINIEELRPLSQRVNRYVQPLLDPWLKKDEFETLAEYQARMKGKKKKIGELMGEAFDSLGVFKGATIGAYDAESESFKLSAKGVGDLIVSVPRAQARTFKESFASFKFTPSFVDSGNGWTLSRLEMAGGGQTYVYDTARQAVYSPVVFDVKTSAAGDMELTASKEVKTQIRKVALATADDVGILPAFNAKARPDDVAVVIGVERYRGLPKSTYSRGDAELVKRYLTAMGFRERNVVMLLDEGATFIDFKKTLETWLKNVAKPNSRVVVYYSGHGAPDAASGEGFLVPYDGDPEYLQDTAYPLKKLIAGLGTLDIKEAVVVLDSCFSGIGGRSVLAKNARPLVIKQAGPALGERVALLSATGGDQVSTSSEELGHGVATYYFLKALKDGKKSLADVYGYMKPLVEDEARRQNANQSPTLSPSPAKAQGRFALAD